MKGIIAVVLGTMGYIMVGVALAGMGWAGPTPASRHRRRAGTEAGAASCLPIAAAFAGTGRAPPKRRADSAGLRV